MLPAAGGPSAVKGNPMYPATPGGTAPHASSAAFSPDKPDARCTTGFRALTMSVWRAPVCGHAKRSFLASHLLKRTWTRMARRGVQRSFLACAYGLNNKCCAGCIAIEGVDVYSNLQRSQACRPCV